MEFYQYLLLLISNLIVDIRVCIQYYLAHFNFIESCLMTHILSLLVNVSCEFKNKMYSGVVGLSSYKCQVGQIGTWYCSCVPYLFIAYLFCQSMREYIEISNPHCGLSPHFSYVSFCFTYFKILFLVWWFDSFIR